MTLLAAALLYAVLGILPQLFKSSSLKTFQNGARKVAAGRLALIGLNAAIVVKHAVILQQCTQYFYASNHANAYISLVVICAKN